MTDGLIERHSYPPRPAPLTDLPFVADVKVGTRKTSRSFWHVPHASDYGRACDAGRQFACDWAQYLKDNSFWVGSGHLGWIVFDMNQQRGANARGYAVGFLAFIERLVHLAVLDNDPYTIAEHDARRMAALMAKLEAEERSR